MSDQYLAEIRAFGFNFAPYGWMQCNGQLLPISQYAALFSLLGTTFGGDGKSTFGLPDLMGSVPMHWGNGVGLSSYVLGEAAGAPTETVTYNQMPIHNHMIQVAEAAGGTTEATDTPGPTAWLGGSTPAKVYLASGVPNVQLAAAISIAGGSIPHENMQPYLTLNFCIAVQGIFPPHG